MLIGSADLDSLARRAAELSGYFAEPVELTDVVLYQMVLEMRNGAREAVLPPSLHPTTPSSLSMRTTASTPE